MKTIFAITILLITLFSSKSYADCSAPVISGPPNWPPFIRTNADNKLQGPALEFVDSFFASQNIKAVHSESKPWKRVQSDMERGHVDLAAAMLKTNERKSKFAYTESWTNDRYGIIVLKDHVFQYAQIEDLNSKTGAYYRGVTFPEPYNSFVKAKKNITPVSNIASLIKMLNKGRVDYLLVAIDTFFATLPEGISKDHFFAISSSIVAVPVHIAFSRKSECQELIPTLNAYIRENRVFTN
ncbi:MAG: transporter substrate-binding domain-containing protein [Sneathiella sp.]|nr:transporter substrate-binding domain-containing protein [Sneathiella sp.]